MTYAYDLHIHTAASPCGDDLMTPHNIVNMSLLKGLQLIAITDHQTVCNCEAVMKVGERQGLKVIPGMEIECKEGFHLIALFKTIEKAREMEAWLEPFMPPILNKPQLFGYQRVINEADEQVGEIKRLLITAVNQEALKVVTKARALDAIIYPAHIDRISYSIITHLGNIPEILGFELVEVSQAANKSAYEKKYSKMTVIQASDAHYLENIAESTQTIEKEILEKYRIL